ncbi:MAG: flagellar hook-associated protein FlgK [Rhodocyclales bacterium GT-UBC]|nr:MAG: flagellar hook-associated protein FlgK [Rhodocyclales bacterium GT-UBC]
MASGLISIAMTGIGAAQTGLLTTSNNISNLNTEGYTRQRIIQASNSTVMTGAGGIGQGTHVVTVSRMYSEALTKQVLSAQSSVSSLDTYYGQISQIDNMLADKTAGLTPVIQKFFDGIQAVASNPSSTSARSSMVTAAQTMVDSFKSMYSRLDELNDGVNSQIGSMVNSINGYTKEIAQLNQQIVSAASLNGQPSNDLLDKRDQLVSELNKLVQVNVTNNTDGTYNVFVGTGQQLVVGTQVTQMAAVASASDPSRIVVGLVGASSGTVQELPESLITGGTLGGMLSFRSQALDKSFNQLGLMAASVAQTFNAQNALGQDMLGNIAGSSSFVANLFNTDQPTVIANSKNTFTPAPVPVVSATLSAASSNGTNFYTNLTASDYQLEYDGTNFSLTRLSDNKSWSGGSIAAINTAMASANELQGFTLSATAGSFTAGDKFLIQPTRDLARNFAVNSSVAADPRLIAAGTPARAGVSLSNTGSVTVGSVSVATGYSVAGLPLSLTYNGTGLTGFPVGSVTVSAGGTSTTYPITAATDVVPFTSGATVTVNATATATSPAGISMIFSGVPATGDTFTISANTSGVEDSGNILRLGKLQTQNTMNGGTATYQDNYASFVNDIGNKTSSAEVSSTAQTTLLNQATAARESVSGVNRDEEAAKLIEYQQAYQASAKVLEIASKLFDTMISLAG